MNTLCPCGTGKKYKKCCQPFHTGKLPDTALELMRSRYCAYCIGDSSYIIKTTHPDNQDFQENTLQWEKEILEFSHSFHFEKLTILNFVENQTHAFVTFTAQISTNGQDCSFTEKSAFHKINGRWLYKSGEHFK